MNKTFEQAFNGTHRRPSTSKELNLDDFRSHWRSTKENHSQTPPVPVTTTNENQAASVRVSLQPCAAAAPSELTHLDLATLVTTPEQASWHLWVPHPCEPVIDASEYAMFYAHPLGKSRRARQAGVWESHSEHADSEPLLLRLNLSNPASSSLCRMKTLWQGSISHDGLHVDLGVS